MGPEEEFVDMMHYGKFPFALVPEEVRVEAELRWQLAKHMRKRTWDICVSLVVIGFACTAMMILGWKTENRINSILISLSLALTWVAALVCAKKTGLPAINHNFKLPDGRTFQDFAMDAMILSRELGNTMGWMVGWELEEVEAFLHRGLDQASATERQRMFYIFSKWIKFDKATCEKCLA